MVVLYSIIVSVFIYVETNVTTSKIWWDLTAKVCPNLKETDMLHYHNINGCAYLLYIPTYFAIKALNFNVFKYYQPYRPS